MRYAPPSIAVRLVLAVALAILGCSRVMAAPPPEERVYDVGGDVRPPVVVKRVEPTIPRGARCRGMVVLRAVIGADGRPREVRDISRKPDAVTKAAAEALPRWRFRPATLHGKPVAVHYFVTVNLRCR